MTLVGKTPLPPPLMQEAQETLVQSLGGEDPLEEGMATHSSILPGESTMDRGAWWATGPWGLKESDMTDVTWHTCGVCKEHVLIFENRM